MTTNRKPPAPQPASRPEMCARPDGWWNVTEQRPFDPARDPSVEVPTKIRPRPRVPDPRAIIEIPYQYEYRTTADGDPGNPLGEYAAVAKREINDLVGERYFQVMAWNCQHWAQHVKRVARGLECPATPQIVPDYVKEWAYDFKNPGPVDFAGRVLVPPCVEMIDGEPVGLPVDPWTVIAGMDPLLRARAAAMIPGWQHLATPLPPTTRLVVTRGALARSIRKLLTEAGVV